MPTAAIPTPKELQKLSTESGRVNGEIERALYRLELAGKDGGPRIGPAELGHITYFIEGLRLDAGNLFVWADKLEEEACALFEGWPAETVSA
jgi:predicted ATPase